MTIMRDQRVSYVARVKATKKLLKWGYGAATIAWKAALGDARAPNKGRDRR